MSNLNDFIIDAWIEECEREDDPEDFIRRFFYRNKLERSGEVMCSDLEEYAEECLSLMGGFDETFINMVLNTLDWKLIEQTIQTYYNENLQKYHLAKDVLEKRAEEAAAAAAEFFAIIDKEAKQMGLVR